VTTNTTVPSRPDACRPHSFTVRCSRPAPEHDSGNEPLSFASRTEQRLTADARVGLPARQRCARRSCDRAGQPWARSTSRRATRASSASGARARREHGIDEVLQGCGLPLGPCRDGCLPRRGLSRRRLGAPNRGRPGAADGHAQALAGRRRSRCSRRPNEGWACPSRAGRSSPIESGGRMRGSLPATRTTLGTCTTRGQTGGKPDCARTSARTSAASLQLMHSISRPCPGPSDGPQERVLDNRRDESRPDRAASWMTSRSEFRSRTPERTCQRGRIHSNPDRNLLVDRLCGCWPLRSLRRVRASRRLLSAQFVSLRSVTSVTTNMA
jgi:hypothetical protein